MPSRGVSVRGLGERRHEAHRALGATYACRAGSQQSAPGRTRPLWRRHSRPTGPRAEQGQQNSGAQDTRCAGRSAGGRSTRGERLPDVSAALGGANEPSSAGSGHCWTCAVPGWPAASSRRARSRCPRSRRDGRASTGPAAVMPVKEAVAASKPIALLAHALSFFLLIGSMTGSGAFAALPSSAGCTSGSPVAPPPDQCRFRR